MTVWNGRGRREHASAGALALASADVASLASEPLRWSSPEVALQVAVLEDAMGVLRLAARGVGNARFAAEAQAVVDWMAEPDVGYVFGFPACCDAIGSTAHAVRVRWDAMGLLRGWWSRGSGR